MLERLRLRDFQRHEDFRVVFDERVSTFVGPNDAGKSAILRALRWVTTNKPSGLAFVRHGQKEAIVSLWLDGRRLDRRKGKVNEIKLDGEPLEAFGKGDLPEPVRQLCNVDDANFQWQHDPPFWLSLTAGQASRELNAVVNLDEIDRTLAAVQKSERRARTEAELCEKRKEEAEEYCESLGWVTEMESEWREVEKKQVKLLASEKRLELLAELLSDVERLREQACVEVPDTSKLDAMVAEMKTTEGHLREAMSLLHGRAELVERIDGLEKQAEKQQAELDERSGGICPLCGGEL